MIHTHDFAIIFLASLLLALIGTPAARTLALRLGVMDQPDARRVHLSPTPLLGGLAIFSAVILGLAFAGFLESYAFGALIGACFILLVGIWDDVYHISPAAKLLGQVVAAAVLVLFGIAVEISGLPWLDAVITIFWVVGITNAFNLLDNMDGLSAGVAVIASFSLFAVGAHVGQFLVASFALALAGACLGFLYYNFLRAPARIFMGDTGSMFVGFMLAVLAVRLVYDSPRWVTPFIPIAILALPIIDTTFVTLNRLRKGQRVYHGGKDHLSHQLVAYFGLRGRAAVIMLWLGAAFLCAVAVLIVTHHFLAAVIAAFSLALFLAVLFLGMQRRAQKHPPAEPEVSFPESPASPPQELKKALVVLPTYNESENIKALCEEILCQHEPLNILVVDDNSPDQTADIVLQMSQGDSRVRLLKREGKLGLGTAYMAGFEYGLEHGYDCVITMDADFSHNPAHLPDILAAAAQFDIVIGSRYIPGGGIENWPWFRRLLSRTANALTRAFLGLPAHDCTSGYRCYSREALEATPWRQIRANGYAFLEEMLFRTFRAGHSVGESPIIFVDRRAGQSKISKTEILNAMLMLLRLSLERLRPADGASVAETTDDNSAQE